MASLDEAVSEETLRQSRLMKLEAMVQKRKSNFEYLRKLHTGDAFW